MNNREVAAVLMRDHRARRVFRGVYPRNKLPHFVDTRRPSAFVINTDQAPGPGEHWVAVWFDGRGKAEYFDSFGLPPLHPDIESFISRHSQSYLYNPRLLQDLSSSMCGVYVLYYIFMKSRGSRMSRILSPFHPHKLWTNDRKVWSMVQQLKRT